MCKRLRWKRTAKRAERLCPRKAYKTLIVGPGNPQPMFEILSAAGALPVNAIGWLVTLLGIIAVALWILYLYR